ncbi:MAG: cysteine desulfurase [Flavobacteriales bacterium]|nr:MAG: cysteine desulfurase [Flavobacteriales bacterium]
MIKNSLDIRNDFPILRQKVHGKPLVYLDNAASSQKPAVVIEAVKNYYETINANVHRGNHLLSQLATEATENARDAVKSFINAAEREEVIFTKGTTDSINLVAASITKFVSEKDNIVISHTEHHANIVPWQMLCERTGAKLRVIPLNEMGEWDVEKGLALIDEHTAVLALGHVSNALGTINPIEQFIKKARAHEAAVLLDGAQSAAHMKVDVQNLDCDFFCFSGHKLCAPTGIGILYGKRTWLEKLPPYQGGGEMIHTVTFEKTTYADIPFKFEAGTPNMAGMIGMGAAIEYLQNIGMNKVAQLEDALLQEATSRLLQIDGLKIYGNAKEKAAVISFLVEGVHPYDLGTLLDKFGVAVRTGHHCTQPIMDFFNIPGTVRASFAFYNSSDDIEAFITALNKSLNMLR